jgi:Ca2+-transporting ATPase
MNFEGLSEKEVLERRKKYGWNLILEKERLKVFSIFISQFKNPLIYILLFVGAVSLIFGEFFDFLLVILVVILNVLMGFFQEYNAKKTLYALRKIIKPMVMVIREGKRKLIEAKELVPGDLVVLISGDKIPADGRLIQGEILVSEAILTGEEEGITKRKGDKVFMGTTVLSGKGVMEVEKIGKETEFGKIGKALVEIEEGKNAFAEKIGRFIKRVSDCCLNYLFFDFSFPNFNWRRNLSRF